jgi:hypothetical protein
MLSLVSEYGDFRVMTGTSGTEVERLRIDSSGNVGIGVTTTNNPLHVQKDAGGHAIAYFNSLNADGYGVLIRTADTGNDKYILRLDSNSGSTPVMYATNSGNVGIGTTSPSTKLEVNGTATVTALVETSTRELKENIETLEDQSTIVDSLQPVSYTWKEDGKEDFGLVAEDVEEIAPHLVHRNEDGKPTGIKYSKLSVLLLDVVQRQSTLINDLNERITKLENERGS